MTRFLVLLPFSLALLKPASLERSRPSRPWEFIDATGQQASLLGKEDGAVDAYIYPLKIFSDLRFSFDVGGRVIPAAAISRRVSIRTGSASVIYAGDEFRVVETLISPVHE